MSVSDWSTLAVAVLTFFGLLVAAFTFYRSLGSKADLELSVGDELILHYAGDQRLILTATFVVINKGSMPGTVTQLSAHIHGQATSSPTLVTFSIQPGTRARKPRDYPCVLHVAAEHAKDMQARCTEVGGSWKQRLVFRRKRGFGPEQGSKNAGGTFVSREFRAQY